MIFFIINIFVIGIVIVLLLKLNKSLDNCQNKRKSAMKQIANSDNHKQQELATFPEMIKMYGYKSETHSLTTTDGYILIIHRIRKKNIDTKETSKPVVLFVHGLGCTTEFWIFRGPDEDLAFLLENDGYDVWLINFRGNYYSNRHVTLNSDRDYSFWDFSFDEMGLHDLPMTIDYILGRTKNTKLTLVGYSMGNAATYVLLSSKPEYNEKINLIISLAPVAIYVRPQKTFFRPLLPYLSLVHKFFELLKIYDVRIGLSTVTFFYEWTDNWPRIERFLQTHISYVAGACAKRNIRPVKYKFFKRVLHYQQRAPFLKNVLVHYAQLQNTRGFRPFDRSFQVNKGEKDYLLEKVKVPVIAYYGLNDGLARKYNVEALVDMLPNAIAVGVDEKLFTHSDFLHGVDTKKLLYDSIIFNVNKHNNMLKN